LTETTNSVDFTTLNNDTQNYDVDSGYSISLNPATGYYYINVGDNFEVKDGNDGLKAGDHPFYLHSVPDNDDFIEFWEDEFVSQEENEDVKNEIRKVGQVDIPAFISGSPNPARNPAFWLRVADNDGIMEYQLIDGLHLILPPDNDGYRIKGNMMPLGPYTYAGQLTAPDEVPDPDAQGGGTDIIFLDLNVGGVPPELVDLDLAIGTGSLASGYTLDAGEAYDVIPGEGASANFGLESGFYPFDLKVHPDGYSGNSDPAFYLYVDPAGMIKLVQSEDPGDVWQISADDPAGNYLYTGVVDGINGLTSEVQNVLIQLRDPGAVNNDKVELKDSILILQKLMNIR